jgi:cholesterol oxidase
VENPTRSGSFRAPERGEAAKAEYFEELRAEVCNPKLKGPHFDLVIVGSGYGGAMAASVLAGCVDLEGKPFRICVLERGLEYDRTDFPASIADLPGHVRWNGGNKDDNARQREGLFDIRIGADVSTVLANGLGGGSLINAGVMIEPSQDVLDDASAWPAALRAEGGPKAWYSKAVKLLGVEPLANSPVGEPPAVDFLRTLGRANGTEYLPPALSISMKDKEGEAAPARNGCVQCGDCTTGCRQGAKRSLDVTVLDTVRRRGVRLVTGATVLSIRKPGGGTAGWTLEVVHTDARLRERQIAPLQLQTQRVILSAGTYGSTEILMRSRSPTLRFSNALGSRFSTNGDSIAVAWDLSSPVTPVGPEPGTVQSKPVDSRAGKHSARVPGPTISGTLDFRTASGRKAGILLQTFAIPAALRRLYAEITLTTSLIDAMSRVEWGVHTPDDKDPCAIEPGQIERSMAFGMMGDDGAEGRMELLEDHRGDGAIAVRWPTLRDHELFERQIETLQSVLAQGGHPNARVLAQPLWRPVPPAVAGLIGLEKRGPLVTVHPLGGCPMGEHAGHAVVDDLGQVFDGASTDGITVHEGLFVLDGSIVPRALGANPALTIAALSLRAAEKLKARWSLSPALGWTLPLPIVPIVSGPSPSPSQPPGSTLASPHAPSLDKTPVSPPTDRRSIELDPPETRIEIAERLCGKLTLRDAQDRSNAYMVELTLRSEPVAVGVLMQPERKRLKVSGQLRVFVPEHWARIEHPRTRSDLYVSIESSNPEGAAQKRYQDLERSLDETALIVVDIGGHIQLLHREPSGSCERIFKGLLAWLSNGGDRIVARGFPGKLKRSAANLGGQLVSRVRGRQASSEGGGVWTFGRNAFATASRAGEVRRLDYVLQTTKVTRARPASRGNPFDPQCFEDQCLRGFKRLTYDAKGNPWKQLTRLTVSQFPGLNRLPLGENASTQVLQLDLRHLARRSFPLLRIVEQRDQPTALADLGGLAMYWLRLMIWIHLWSFRAPEAGNPEPPKRLPGKLPGLPDPEIHTLATDPQKGTASVCIRLTRYPCRVSNTPPVVLIHGYSASGTTFAHPAVRPNLATTLWKTGRDVWIVDLRTSAGLPTGILPWRFEDPALVDIPEALQFVHDTRAKEGLKSKIDVFAHCMGAVMFSMAVLREPPEADARENIEPDVPVPSERLKGIRKNLPNIIGRVALSQSAPVLAFSPANILRAYFMRWLRPMLPFGAFSFRTEGSQSTNVQLIDRLLATLPYPDGDFAIEYPNLFQRNSYNGFVGSRRRMDILFGRLFELWDEETKSPRLSNEVLRNIDDLFGPIHLETIAQTIHFARHQLATDSAGRGVYVNDRSLRERWSFPTLYLHGDKNAVLDVAALARAEDRMQATGGGAIEVRAMKGFGHQDSLIGCDAEKIFAEVIDWFDGRSQGKPDVAAPRGESPLSIRPPVLGPLLVHRCDELGGPFLRLGTDRSFGAPIAILLVEVTVEGDRFKPRGFEILQAQNEGEGWWHCDLPAGLAMPGPFALMILVVYGQPDWLGKTFQRDLATFSNSLGGGLNGNATERLNRWMDGVRRLEMFSGGPGEPTELSQLGRKLFKGLSQIEKKLSEKLGETPRAELEQSLFAYRIARASTGSSRNDHVIDAPHGTTSKQAVQPPCLLVGSCQYPAGMLDARPADAAFGRMGILLEANESPHPQALVLLGDQIYSDASAGLFDPVRVDERQSAPYRALLSAQHARKVVARIPVLALPDDHEIEDNWEPLPPTAEGAGDGVLAQREARSSVLAARLATARTEFSRAFGRGGPSDHQPVWGPTTFDGHPLFLVDTRTRRSHRDPARIMEALITDPDEDQGGPRSPVNRRQVEDLEAWLLAGRDYPGPRFIASPAILLPRRRSAIGRGRLGRARALRSDAWDGYPGSLHRLLAFIARNRLRRLVFVSGDEHTSCVARVRVWQGKKRDAITLFSVHCSALYAPWPFANSRPAEFAGNERFRFAAPLPAGETSAPESPRSWRRYTCEVKTRFIPISSGFGRISVQQYPRGWGLRCDFFDARGSGRVPDHRVLGLLDPRCGDSSEG